MLRPKKLSPVAFYTNNCTFCLRNTCVQHFLMSRHFLPHVETNEAANNSNNNTNSYTAPCVALWLLSRIALISQFIAIYKNMKNADGIQIRVEGEMHKGRAQVGRGEGATNDRPMQIKFKRVFSSFVCRFDLTKPMDAMEPLLQNFNQYHLNLDLTSDGCAL